MPRVPGTLFSTDTQKKPTFEKKGPCFLTEDYTKLYVPCSKYFKNM